MLRYTSIFARALGFNFTSKHLLQVDINKDEKTIFSSHELIEYSRLYGRDDDDFSVPLSMTFTRYHVLLLFPERVIAVSLIAPADRNASQVMDEDYCSDVNG